MRKRRKIDFVLHESDFEKVIFRFYPRQSNCHSFGDKPPTKWEEVYKVYYSYRIMKIYKEDGSHVILFDCPCDECSEIYEVAERCKLIADGTKSITRAWEEKLYTIELLDEVKPFGMGVFWKISECNDNAYKIEMWNWDDTGYRFWLDRNKLRKFGNYLQKCCEYMLVHGDPI